MKVGSLSAPVIYQPAECPLTHSRHMRTWASTRVVEIEAKVQLRTDCQAIPTVDAQYSCPARNNERDPR